MGLSVAAPFVWRCPSTRAVAPFPHPAHRTGQADFPHPALGQDIMLSPSGSRGCQCRGCDRRVRDLGSIEHDTVPPLPAPPVTGRRVSRTGFESSLRFHMVCSSQLLKTPEFRRVAPISTPSSLRASALNQGSFPPSALPDFSGTTSPSATPPRPTHPSRVVG